MEKSSLSDQMQMQILRLEGTLTDASSVGKNVILVCDFIELKQGSMTSIALM